MFLLNRLCHKCYDTYASALHPNMFLLNRISDGYRKKDYSFTSQYVSIKSCSDYGCCMKLYNFTSQYVSIKSAENISNIFYKRLFTSQYVSIKSIILKRKFIRYISLHPNMFLLNLIAGR